LIYICFAVGLILSACSRDEASLFSSSAAERLQAEKEAATKQLCSATNGWEMLYFPNSEGAGYAFLMEFSENGLCQIAAKNDISCNSHLYNEQTSLWNIDFTQAVVLTFDSYNDLFHIFSDPQDDGVGYAGDYEFVILKRYDNQIYLKGKKYGTYLYLNRMSDEMDWNSYFQQVDGFVWNSFCGSKSKEMYLFGADTAAMEITYKDGLFTYTKDKVTHVIPTVVSPTGLHCYTSVPNLGNVEAKDFVFNSDSSRLTCTADGTIYFTNKMTLGEFYKDQLKNKARFWADSAKMDATKISKYRQLCQDLSDNKAQLKRVAYSAFDSTNIVLVDYLVEGKLMQGYMTATMKLTGDTISYSDFKADASIKPLLKRFSSEAEGISRFAEIFGGEYHLKSNITTINPSQIVLVSKQGDSYLMVRADSQAL